MGLDISHDCWHGSYGAFHRWRTAVAKAAGIPLVLMDGFHECPAADAMDWARARDGGPLCGHYNGPILQRWCEEVDAVLPLPWSIFNGNPLVALLSHPDNEGEIAAADCGPLADKLEALLPALDEMGDGGGHVGMFGDKTRTFITGLRLAVSLGEPIEFH